jgi:hypothetical protein
MKPLLDEIARNIARVSYMKHTSVSSISFEGFFQQYEAEFMEQAQAAIDVVSKRLFAPYFAVRLKNAISRMNLHRPDIAALGSSGIISKNITCEREVDAILKEMLAAWQQVKGK